MEPRTDEKAESLSRFLMNDHKRIDAFLQSATSDLDTIDQGAYDQFRSALLRHIGMEEKILLPALQRLQGGTPFPHTARLRLDHGALAALMMPSPMPPILATINAILSVHNRLEEGPDGLYAACDRLAPSETDVLIARLRAAPDVAVTPPSDSPAVMKNLHSALERAGYHLTAKETAGENKTL